MIDVATVTLNPAIDRTVTISGFTAGEVNRVAAWQDAPGGKGVNVASTLADCGFLTCASGFLGRDNAAIFEALFSQKEIEDRFVRIAGATRFGIKINDPVRKLTTDINFPGLSPEPADLAALRETLARIDSKWWVLAGSLPPGVPPGIYREIIAAAKSRGERVALDTSGNALAEGIHAGPHLIKPNLDELQTLLGRPIAGQEAIIKAARELMAVGIEMVVVSMGAQGAYFVTGSEVVIARPPRIETGSTVGAGDAMVAGCVAAQIRGLALMECARLASAFSLWILTHSKGAIQEWMSQVTVEKVG